MSTSKNGIKKKMTKVVLEITELNPHAAIGGSYACIVQGMKLNRKINDLDFSVGTDAPIKLPDECTNIEIRSTHYGGRLLCYCTYKGLKLNFLLQEFAQHINFKGLPFNGGSIIFQMVHISSIMAAKKIYIKDTSTRPDQLKKHQTDLALYEEYLLSKVKRNHYEK